MAPDHLTCWVLTDGKPGMENQCLGLAEALGLQPVVKRVAIRNPWRSLPPQAWVRPFAALAAGSDPVAVPWPDLLIATGRQTVALSMAVRRASGGWTFTVQIQNPVVAPRHFDLVAAPRHDGLSGTNVIETFGALSRVNADTIAASAATFAAGLAHLPRPLVAVLIGGSNKVYRMTSGATADLAAKLKGLSAQTGCGFAVTPSRRTGAANEAALRQALRDLPHVWWDGSGANPYLGWLGLADGFVVTADSVNMVSEACGTGKPVFVHDLPGGNAKFRRFHQALRDAGMTRTFTGAWADWTYPPLNDTATVADAVRDRIAAHGADRDRMSG